jgi:DNA-binding IclR family transcriptional regulator
MKELTSKRLKILKQFHNKQQLAKKHNFEFSMRRLSEEIDMNYNTFYAQVGYLIQQGFIKPDKSGLTDLGLQYFKK